MKRLRSAAIDFACRILLCGLFVLALCVGLLIGLFDRLTGHEIEPFDYEPYMFDPRRPPRDSR